MSGTPEGAAAADAFLSLSADAYEQSSAEERFEFNFDLPQTVPNARATALLHAVHGEVGIETDADLELMTVEGRDDGSVVVAVDRRPPALGRARSCHLPGWLVQGLDLKLHRRGSKPGHT